MYTSKKNPVIPENPVIQESPIIQEKQENPRKKNEENVVNPSVNNDFINHLQFMSEFMKKNM